MLDQEGLAFQGDAHSRDRLLFVIGPHPRHCLLTLSNVLEPREGEQSRGSVGVTLDWD
jgi:hypothetical protein